MDRRGAGKFAWPASPPAAGEPAVIQPEDLWSASAGAAACFALSTGIGVRDAPPPARAPAHARCKRGRVRIIRFAYYRRLFASQHRTLLPRSGCRPAYPDRRALNRAELSSWDGVLLEVDTARCPPDAALARNGRPWEASMLKLQGGTGRDRLASSNRHGSSWARCRSARRLLPSRRQEPIGK